MWDGDGDRDSFCPSLWGAAIEPLRSPPCKLPLQNWFLAKPLITLTIYRSLDSRPALPGSDRGKAEKHGCEGVLRAAPLRPPLTWGNSAWAGGHERVRTGTDNPSRCHLGPWAKSCPLRRLQPVNISMGSSGRRPERVRARSDSTLRHSGCCSTPNFTANKTEGRKTKGNHLCFCQENGKGGSWRIIRGDLS